MNCIGQIMKSINISLVATEGVYSSNLTINCSSGSRDPLTKTASSHVVNLGLSVVVPVRNNGLNRNVLSFFKEILENPTAVMRPWTIRFKME